jgi:hypothetical protein
MISQGLLEVLGYGDSPSFLTGESLDVNPSYSHIFRRFREGDAADNPCGLVGVYALREPSRSACAIVPTVYVCEAYDDFQAGKIHKNVWNQNIVPFLIVCTIKHVNVYSGFCYSAPGDNTTSESQGIIKTGVDHDRVVDELSAFHAQQIDNGRLWKDWGNRISPSNRVDWRLLSDLRKLDIELQALGLDKETAHALIGKYVYLRYLRDREILSDIKLQEWHVDINNVFGSDAKVEVVIELAGKIEERFNGSVFPLKLDPQSERDRECLKKVAETFLGHSPGGQRHLNFEAYQFDYIPIETLSVIYEQFLHSSWEGKDAGAYYTPLPLVNFILEELDYRRPLTDGMRIIDPSCGSGAFLVQCYRRLIELELRKTGGAPVPHERLRDLLVNNIFGIDQDSDACRVTELGLILTLLDNVNPPDLHDNEHFKLPTLLGANIFDENFFDDSARWNAVISGAKFDWVVGNPPWKEIDEKKLKPHEIAPLSWMKLKENRRNHPVARRQLAEAFAWKSLLFASEDGILGLLLPVSTLLKANARLFRRRFFKTADVWCVVNFANLRRVLFHNAIQPAAAFFYSKPHSLEKAFSADREVVIYSPFLANQEVGRHTVRRERKEMWGLVVNRGEIQGISYEKALSGRSLPWKLAMWGNPRDTRLFNELNARFPSLALFSKDHSLALSQGVMLRDKHSKEPVEIVEEFVGKNRLDVNSLKDYHRIYSIPPEAIRPVHPSRTYVRMGRKRPVSICSAPHIVVSAAWTFSVFSHSFLVIPHPHFGISGEPSQGPLLKALSLFLSSRFATYHQFLSAPLWGVERNRVELKPFLTLPIPLDHLGEEGLTPWVDLYDRLAGIPTAQFRRKRKSAKIEDGLFRFAQEEVDFADEIEVLVELVNHLAYEALELSESERWQVEDFVNVKMGLMDGRLGKEAVARPSKSLIRDYCQVVCRELANYFHGDSHRRYQASAIFDDLLVSIEIRLIAINHKTEELIRVEENSNASSKLAEILSDGKNEHAQWFYFERSLRVLIGESIYVFKPMQIFHLTRSQAVADANEIVAEKIQSSRR